MTNNQLFAWRAAMGWTQAAAATNLGITRVTYQKLERGVDWKTGAPALIDRRTALACAAMVAGLVPL